MADEIQKKLNEAEDKLTEVKETPTAPDAPLEDVQSGTVRDARMSASLQPGAGTTGW